MKLEQTDNWTYTTNQSPAKRRDIVTNKLIESMINRVQKNRDAGRYGSIGFDLLHITPSTKESQKGTALYTFSHPQISTLTSTANHLATFFGVTVPTISRLARSGKAMGPNGKLPEGTKIKLFEDYT